MLRLGELVEPLGRTGRPAEVRGGEPLRADQVRARLPVRLVLGETVGCRPVPVARVVVRLVAALGTGQPRAEDALQGVRLVRGQRWVEVRQVDADLGLPAGGAQDAVQSGDVRRGDHVGDPGGQRVGRLLAGRYPQRVAVQLVAGDADVAAPEVVVQRGQVALPRVKVAGAVAGGTQGRQLAHLVGQPD